MSFFVLFCVLRTWLGFLPSWDMQVASSSVCRQCSHQGGNSKIWLHRNMRCIPFTARGLPTVARFQVNCLSLSLFGLFWGAALKLQG